MQTLRQETETAENRELYCTDVGVGVVRKGTGGPGNPGGVQGESREQGKRAKRWGAEVKTRSWQAVELVGDLNR